MRRLLLLVLLGAAIEACLLGIGRIDPSGQGVHRLWLLMLPAFASYAFVVFLCRGPQAGRWFLLLIVVLACVFRLTLITADPWLSDDVYRYVWDGRTQGAGINPYSYRPADAELQQLRDEAYNRVNHKDVPTIYPPASQIAFAFVYRVWPGVLGMKSFLVAVDLALIGLLVKLLLDHGLPAVRVAVYAWNPLVILEVAGSGHSDGLGVLFLLLAVYYLKRGRETVSAAALACSFLAKFFGGALVPLFAAHLSRAPRRVCLYILTFLAVAVLGYLPYIGAGRCVLSGLFAYAGNWEFNGPVFSSMSAALGTPSHARLVVALAFAGVVAFQTVMGADPIRAIFVSSGAFLLLSPTVHPWYLLWIVPLLCFFRSPGWIAFSGTAVLSYQALVSYRSTALWRLEPWVLWVEYVPLFVMLIIELCCHRGPGYGKLRY